MTQPKFADGPPVPLMVEGLIDSPTLARLFADIETVAAILSVREKGGPAEFAETGETPPAAALDRLLAGTARAVQVRYHFDGYEWSDTVVAVPNGYRVIRCRHPG